MVRIGRQVFFFCMVRRPPGCTVFPYAALFRSVERLVLSGGGTVGGARLSHDAVIGLTSGAPVKVRVKLEVAAASELERVGGNRQPDEAL